MKEYVANKYTSIFPFGIIAKGEVLTKQHIDALGDAGIADMLKRGIISEFGIQPDQDEKDIPAMVQVPTTEGEPDAQEARDMPEESCEAGESDLDDEEPADLNIESAEDIVADQHPNPKKAGRPRKENKK